MRSIAAAADRFGGRPSALGMMPPKAVEARTSPRRAKPRRANRGAIDWEASGEEVDGGETHTKRVGSPRENEYNNGFYNQ